MDASSRGVPRAARAEAYRELHEEKRAPVYGGKGAFDLVVEELAAKIGYKHPGSVHLTMREVWARFIKENRELVDRGNSMIAKDEEFTRTGIISSKTQDELRSIIRNMGFSRDLKVFIKARTAKLKGWLIGRSSGIYEDGFETSLAGVFSSFKKSDERFVVRAVRDVFADSIGKVWIDQNKREKRLKGVPETLNEKEGFAVVVQPFIKFEAAGTVKTDYYGHTSIEAVFGDADYAVRSVHANAAQFLFSKMTGEYEYHPSYLSRPYEMRIKGEECSLKDNPEIMEELLAYYPRIGPGKELSPLTEEEAREVNRVTNRLEEEIGVPLDIEWGFYEGELYIIQARPMVKKFEGDLVEKEEAAFKALDAVAATPIALGQTGSKGIKGKMVLFAETVSDETTKKFEDMEDGLEGGYIRVQRDVATKVLNTDTKAKVLVDLEQGSRQAHNVTLIEDRIHDGEFAYCNGPVLKRDLTEKVKFIPHPEIEGVWVSEEEITYFADGLNGSFHKKKRTWKEKFDQNLKLPGGVIGASYMRVKNLVELIHAASASGKEYDAGQDIENVYYDFGCLKGFVPLVKYMSSEGKQDMSELMRGFEDEYDLGKYLIGIDQLCAALRYPLLPNEWENPLMKHLVKVKEFRAEYRKWHEKRSRPATRGTSPITHHPSPVVPGKIRVLVMDDDVRKLSDYSLRLTKVFSGDPAFEIQYAASWETAWEKTRETAFDLTILDYDMPKGTIWTDEKIALILPLLGEIVISSEAYPEWMIEAEEEGEATLLAMIWPGRDLREEGFPFLDSARDIAPEMITKIKGAHDALLNVEVPEDREEGDNQPYIQTTYNMLYASRNESSLDKARMRELVEKIGLSPDGEGVYSGKRVFEGKEIKINMFLAGTHEEVDGIYDKVKRSAGSGRRRHGNIDMAIFDVISYRPSGAERPALTAEGSEINDHFWYLRKFQGLLEVLKDPSPEEALKTLEQMVAKDIGRLEDRKLYHDMRVGRIEPRLPEKLTVLFIQDDYRSIGWEDECRSVFHPGEYEFITARIFDEAERLVGTKSIDCCIADIGGTHVEINYRKLRKMFSSGVYGMGLVSGIFEQNDGEEAGGAQLDLLSNAGFGVGDPVEIMPNITGFVKSARLRQEDDYARMRERWLAAGKKTGPDTGVEDAGEGKETVFVIENDPGNAYDLAERIKKERGAKYRVLRMSSMSELSSALGKAVPDIVVTNAFLDEKDELGNIISAVTARNPNARFVIASFDAAARSPLTGRLDTARRKIEEGHDEYMDRLKKVRNKGWDALSEVAKALLMDPEKSSWGETLTPEIYYEIYTFLNPVHPTEDSMKFYNSNPGLFSKRGGNLYQNIRSLLSRIVRLGAINGLDRTAAEKDLLKGYYVHGTVERLPEGSIEAYRTATYIGHTECKKFSQERMIPGEMLGFECGFGDEGDFMPPGYRWDEKVIRMNSMETIIAGARGYLIYGRLDRAINEFKRALIRSLTDADLNKYEKRGGDLMFLARDELAELYRTVDKSLFDPEAVRLVKEELLNMKEGWFEEAGSVAQELGITSIIEAVGEDEKYNIIGIVETPFHFGDVIDVLDGVDKDKEIASGETYKLEEASRICESMSLGKDAAEPGVINIWSGYARDVKQRELLDEIARASKGREYSVRVYDDLSELALEASKDDGTKKVTILPYKDLDQEVRYREYPENSGVLFMEMPETRGEGLYEFTQIGTIVMTGVAYLNCDEDALNRLYSLLTGETHFRGITMPLLREHPDTVRFRIIPAVLNDYNDFTRLNRLTRRMLSFA